MTASFPIRRHDPRSGTSETGITLGDKRIIISSYKMSQELSVEVTPRAPSSTWDSAEELGFPKDEDTEAAELGFQMPVINFPHSYSVGEILTLEHMEYMGKMVDRLHGTTFHKDAPRRRSASKTPDQIQFLHASEGIASEGDAPNTAMEDTFLQCVQSHECDLRLLRLLPPQLQDQLVKDQQRIAEYFRYKNSVGESQKLSKMQDTANDGDDALHELLPTQEKMVSPPSPRRKQSNGIASPKISPPSPEPRQRLQAKANWEKLKAASGIGRKRNSVTKRDPLTSLRRLASAFSSNQSDGSETERRPSSTGTSDLSTKGSMSPMSPKGSMSPMSPKGHGLIIGSTNGDELTSEKSELDEKHSSPDSPSRRTSITSLPVLPEKASRKKGKGNKPAKKQARVLPTLSAQQEKAI